MNLPKQYAWLAKEQAPRILVEALKHYGLKETPGPESTQAIIQWAEELGNKRLGMVYKDDSIAWCGLFAAICAFHAGLDVPPIPVRASQWTTWGTEVKQPMLGDILVFSREGGNHVGIYVGEDSTHYHVLGGNQKDSVCIIRIDKKRLRKSGARRTKWKVAQPPNVRKIVLAATGEVSHNER